MRREKSGEKSKVGLETPGATKVGKREKWSETKVRHAKSGARKVGHR